MVERNAVMREHSHKNLFICSAFELRIVSGWDYTECESILEFGSPGGK